MTLHDELKSAQTEALAILEKVKTEKRDINDEEKKGVEARFSRMKEIKSQIDLEKSINGIDIEGAANAANEAIKSAISQNFNKVNSMENVENKGSILESIKEFARTGSSEKFALTSGTNSGVLMPTSIPDMVVIRQSRNAIRRGFERVGVKPFASSITDNNVIPFLDDVANVANNNAEGATTGVDADSTAVKGDLSLVEYHSKAQWLSKKVVNAQDFDVTGKVYDMLQSRVERQEEIDWVTPIIAATPAVTTASPTATVYGELVALDESLPNYADVPSFYICSPTMKIAIRSLADSNLRPLPGLQLDSAFPTLFGKPLIVCNSLQTVAATHVGLALVTTEAAIIRDTTVNELVRYNPESGHPGQIGFELISWSAFAFSVKAVATLKMHA